MIYDKTLGLPMADHHERLPMTLMSNDVQRIVRGLENFHEVWASTIEVCMAIWLLQLQLGWATMTVLAVFLGRQIQYRLL